MRTPYAILPIAALAVALPCSAQTVVSVNQTGGITADRVGSITCVPECGVMRMTVTTSIVDPQCLVNHGWYVRNADGNYDRTPLFRSLPMPDRRRMLETCRVRVEDGDMAW